MAASEAAVRAAKVAFEIDAVRADDGHEAAIRAAIQASLASLEAAAASVHSTRAALDAALAVGTRGDASPRADG